VADLRHRYKRLYRAETPILARLLLVGVRDIQGQILPVLFFGDIILTYVYVRIGGVLCLSPLLSSSSSAPAF
jgi:hypothetical protein